MKKVSKFFFVCLIGSILFSSCGSNMSITRRHYNNGYYVSYNDSKQNGIIPKEEEKMIQGHSVETVYSPVDQIKEFPGEKNTYQKEIKTNNIVSTASPKSLSKAVLPAKSQFLKRINKIVKVRETIGTLEPSGKNSMKSSSPQRDELSLFWIVILGILIFWAVFFSIGFLLEGLINLLLIIALILLILWLLRIL